MELQAIPALKQQLKNNLYKIGKLVPIGPRNLSEAVEVCRRLHHNDIPTTIGNFSKTGDDPRQIAYEYQLASNNLKGASGAHHCYLSLKPPGLQFLEEYTTAVVATAFKNGNGINFDSHEHELQESTIQLLKQLIDAIGPTGAAGETWRFGLTLPSRWKRSIRDAEWVIEQGVRPRLVKGEFKASHPADELSPEKGFLELIDLLANRVTEIAVATHDYRLAGEAISRARDRGAAVQLELLFGMPTTKMIALAQELKVPVRFYVPYSDCLLLYGIRQFLTNPHKLLRPDLMEILASHTKKTTRIIDSFLTSGKVYPSGTQVETEAKRGGKG